MLTLKSAGLWAVLAGLVGATGAGCARPDLDLTPEDPDADGPDAGPRDTGAGESGQTPSSSVPRSWFLSPTRNCRRWSMP